MEPDRLYSLAEVAVEQVLRARAEREAFSRSCETPDYKTDCLTFARARNVARGQAPTDNELRHLALCATCDRRVIRFQELAGEPAWSGSLNDVLKSVARIVHVPVERIAEWIRIATVNSSLLGAPVLEAACAMTDAKNDRRVQPFVWTDLEVTLEPRSDLDRLFVTVVTRSKTREASTIELSLVGITGDNIQVSVNLERANPDDPFVVGTTVVDEPYDQTITRLGSVIVPVPVRLVFDTY